MRWTWTQDANNLCIHWTPSTTNSCVQHLFLDSRGLQNALVILASEHNICASGTPGRILTEALPAVQQKHLFHNSTAFSESARLAANESHGNAPNSGLEVSPGVAPDLACRWSCLPRCCVNWLSISFESKFRDNLDHYTR